MRGQQSLNDACGPVRRGYAAVEQVACVGGLYLALRAVCVDSNRVEFHPRDPELPVYGFPECLCATVPAFRQGILAACYGQLGGTLQGSERVPLNLYDCDGSMRELTIS